MSEATLKFWHFWPAECDNCGKVLGFAFLTDVNDDEASKWAVPSHLCIECTTEHLESVAREGAARWAAAADEKADS